VIEVKIKEIVDNIGNSLSQPNQSCDFQIWQINHKYKKMVLLIMYETAIRLGRGITKNTLPLVDVTVKEEFFLDIISKFGINRADLKRINPSYDDLLDIYFELKAFGFSTKYCLLKTKRSRI
jgi:hypothetical protein